MKRSLTIILMLLLLGLYGLGVAEHTKEQISYLTDQTAAGGMVESNTPTHTTYYLARQSCLIQFAEEAGGLLSRHCRESLKRIVSSARDVQIRVQLLLLFLLIIIASLLCASAYYSLPGIYVRSSSIRIVTYLHDQDGLK